jgi:hypothetical protein
MSNRDRAIIAQTSAKVAGELCHGKGIEGLTEYAAVAEFVFNDILDKAGETASPAASPAAAPPVMAAAPAPSPVAQVQAAFPGAEIAIAPGADISPPAPPAPPAPTAAKPARGARKAVQHDENGFVTDGRQAAWNVAFLCAGTKTDDGKVVVFDNKRKKESGEWKATAADFNISEAGAAKYGLGDKRIGLWLSDAPTHIQAGDGSIHVFNVEDMHTRCSS